jgi:hypothetical protein
MQREVDRGLCSLKIVRECGFEDLEAKLLRDLDDLSTVLLLATVATDGEPRKRVAELLRRIDEARAVSQPAGTACG